MNNVKGRIQRAEAALDLDPDPEAEAKQAAAFRREELRGEGAIAIAGAAIS